jgi:hypothetical protein
MRIRGFPPPGKSPLLTFHEERGGEYTGFFC